MKKKIYYGAMSAILLFSSNVFATITVDSNPSAQELVTSIFGDGITASNITLNCAGGASGTFTDDGGAAIGFDQGIILGSGQIADVIGPNDSKTTETVNGTSGDADLDSLVTFPTYDACVLEFDFEVSQDITGVSFKYVFASEEYNEYVDEDYNDVFAFLFNGKNIALLPDTAVPVSIHTINYKTNSELYRDNDIVDGNNCQGFGNCPIDTQMDGLTTVLSTAKMEVVSGETYHIKMAIADVADDYLDSNVFIQAGSFEGSFVEPPPVEPQDCEGVGVDTTGIITTRNWEIDTDQAQFKLRDVAGIKAAAYAAVEQELPVTFRFGSCGDPIYEFTVPVNELNVTYLNMRYTVGNLDVVRCVFNSEQCVVNIKNTDLDNQLLDDRLTGEMTVSLEVGGKNYTNTGIWTQFDSGSGSWTKYRKD